MIDILEFQFSRFFIFRALILPGLLFLFTTCCLLMARPLSKNDLPPLISFDLLVLVLLLVSAKKYYFKFRSKHPVLIVNGIGISYVGSNEFDITWTDIVEIRWTRSSCLAIDLKDRKVFIRRQKNIFAKLSYYINILYWGTPAIIQFGDVKGRNQVIFNKILDFYGKIKSGQQQKSV